MKATLLALMTLGSLAFGGVSESITLSTNYDIGGSDAGNGFSGIAFQLTPKTDRYVNSNFITEDATYELTSIAIQWRNDGNTTKIGDGVHLVVTDASKEVLGISNNVSAWADVTIGGVSKISVVTNTFEESIPLTLETPYYAFYVAHANIEDVEVGETLTASVGSVNLMAWGKNGSYTGAYNDFGMTVGVGPATATGVAPVANLAVVKTPNVPEPMTGTLSLLALAGLCIRRRK